jgi:Leucine-rich repeat (LRR) protein
LKKHSVMKRILPLLLLFTPLFSFGQFTAIPDTNFEQALIDQGHDTGTPDGQVLTANISGLSHLNLSNNSISDLTGIEDFTALSYLQCFHNQLTSLDVTQNTALIELHCGFNQLTSLVTQNTALTLLDCQSNQLTSLDVTQNTILAGFACANNQLNCLNLKNGNNALLSYFFSTGNSALTCIEVDDVAWSTSNWTVAGGNIDSGVTFSTNCTNACSTATVGIEEYSNQPKKLIRIIDYLGRETTFKPNTPLIYQYDNGSVEKVMEVW